MKKTLISFALAAVALVAAQDAKPADKGPAVGKPAPVLRLNNQDGVAVNLGGESDTWTILAFYPKAMTPG